VSGIATASAYIVALGTCVWSCAQLTQIFVATVSQEIVTTVSSLEQPPSRVDLWLERQNRIKAAAASNRQVRDPVRAMEAPQLTAVQLARALDVAETARLIRSHPISNLVVEALPAIAVSASSPDVIVTAMTLDLRSLKAQSQKVRSPSNRRLVMVRMASKRNDASDYGISYLGARDLEGANGPGREVSARARKRAVVAKEAAPGLMPSIASQEPHMNASTPGALMFASFIRRGS